MASLRKAEQPAGAGYSPLGDQRKRVGIGCTFFFSLIGRKRSELKTTRQVHSLVKN